MPNLFGHPVRKVLDRASLLEAARRLRKRACPGMAGQVRHYGLLESL